MTPESSIPAAAIDWPTPDPLQNPSPPPFWRVPDELEAPEHNKRARDYALSHREAKTFEATGTPQTVRPGLHISGGVGGTFAHLEDLQLAAAKIEAAMPCVNQVSQQLTALVADAGAWVHRLEWDVEEQIAPWMPPELQAQARYAVGEVQVAGAMAKSAAFEGGTSALVAKADGTDLAGAVEAARASYTEADSETNAALAALSAASDAQITVLNGIFRQAFGPFIPSGSVMGASRNALLLGLAGDQTSPMHELLVDDMANSILKMHPAPWTLKSKGSNMERLAAEVTDVAQQIDGNLIRAGSATLVPTPANLQPVRGLQDAAERVQNLYRLPEVKPGTVAIQKNSLPNDETTWVVMVPGTQGGVTEEHGFDWLSNALLIRGGDAPPTQVVQDAMRQAGIEKNDKVTLIGHSQGGLSAIDISNSDEFDVSHVVTMGTPTALQSSNESTQYLAVEAEKDIVPALDGNVNTDRLNRTTVRSDGTGLDRPEGLEDLDPHSIENYREVLMEAENSGHPSTEAFFRGVRDGVFDQPVPTSQGQYLRTPELFLYEGKASVVN